MLIGQQALTSELMMTSHTELTYYHVLAYSLQLLDKSMQSK